MKNILNLAFYKSLVNSDFSLLISNNNRNVNYIKSDSKINSYNRLKTLDIFQLLKSCKQFIRLLQFVKLTNSSEINIILTNKQYFFLLKKYLVEYPFSGTFNVHYLTNKSKKKANKVVFDIFIGDSKLELQASSIKTSIMNQTFLVQSINSKVDISQNGSYKIYNDTLDFKKIVFLISVLNLVFQNKL